jgi:hypothetical protein
MATDVFGDIRSRYKIFEDTEVHEDRWEYGYPIDLALRIVDIARMRGRMDRYIFSNMGYSRELRIYMSRWISTLRNFEYDHQFSSYLVVNGIPGYVIEQIMNNLEDLVLSTTIILMEEKVTLTDAIEYMGILRKILGIGSTNNPLNKYVVSGGRLNHIASRVALLILFTLSIYVQEENTEE